MRYVFCTLLGAVVLLFPLTAMAVPQTVDWQVVNTVDLPEAVRDMAIAADGRLYLLTGEGTVSIVAADGSDLGTIEVGMNADRITLAPDGNRLYVSDRKGRKMKIVSLTDIQTIPLANSPFKGPADAAIAVVVFSDFQ